jgi:folate-binding protein YgfZ
VQQPTPAPDALIAGHRAVRTTVGIADRSDARAFTRVAGPGAVKFLQGLLSAEVAALPVGSAAYALLLTPKARVICDLRALRLADDAYLLDCHPDAAPAMRSTLTRYRLAARAAIDPVDGEYGLVAVAGPKAGMLVADALGILPCVGAPEGEGGEASAGGETVHVVATVDFGEKALDVIGSRTATAAAFEALAGRLERFDGAVFDEGVAEVLRVEAGVPRFGAEIDERVMPAEAGLVGRSVSFTKGCYVGQEPVARLHYRGHSNRELRALAPAVVPGPDAVVLAGEREVGRITSVVQSPARRGPLALGIVRREVADGDRVRVAWEGGACDAEVVPLPPYDWRATR